MAVQRRLIPLGVLLVAFFALGNVFQSTDPGVRGIIADVSFFGFVILALFFVVIGVRALVRRSREARRSDNR